jgi:5-methylcytosine-specific restriction endonuclease McrA
MKFETPLVVNEEPKLEDFWQVYPDNAKMSTIVFRVTHGVWMRTRLAEAQNWRCCWCGRHASIFRSRRDSATIEHVTPKSEGGTDAWENLAMSCARCNSSRGSEDAATFVAPSKNQKKKRKRFYKVPQ